MEKIAHYRQLLVWQKAIELTSSLYQLTRSFPKEETYGLTSQMRRAAVSIPSNIAEGHARKSAKEYAQFISISMGSIAELETQLYVATNLGFTNETQTQPLFLTLDEIGKMLRSILKKLS